MEVFPIRRSRTAHVRKETWYRKENTHEAIIDQELWNTVQRMLEEKAKPFATGKTGIFAEKK